MKNTWLKFLLLWLACYWASPNCGLRDTLLIRGHHELSGYNQLWVDGGIAYLVEEGRIEFFDFSDPTSPKLFQHYDLPEPGVSGSTYDVHVADGLMFIGLLTDAGPRDVHVVDVRNPFNPVPLLDIEVPGYTRGPNIFYKDQFLYVADCNSPRIAIYDLSQLDPDDPPAGPLTDPTWFLMDVGDPKLDGVAVHNVAVVDGRLYASAWDGGLLVYDVTDIANQPPVFLGSAPGNKVKASWPTDDGRFVMLSQNILQDSMKVFRMDDDGLGGLVFTETDQADSPVVQGVQSAPRHVKIVGNRAYCTWYGHGLRIYDIDPVSGSLSFVANFVDFLRSVYDVYPFLGEDRILISGSGGFHILQFGLTENLLDLTSDGETRIDDLVAMVNRFGPCAAPTDCPEDLNGDEQIDVTDLDLSLACWGAPFL